ncbi:MAG: methyltransferase [Hyphomicrobiaceae bacterium]|nr:methyltransferase [Hyphomicrobiaceae bacterium]
MSPVRPSGGGVVDAPTEVMIGCLEVLQPMRLPLVVGEPSGRLAAVLIARGASPGEWLRQAVQGRADQARPWPDDDTPRDAALIRLPKARDALDLALHASASKIAPGGPIAVFGANDEGVRSAAARLEAVASSIVTLETRRHSRVIAGMRRPDIERLKGRLADWRRVHEIEILGLRRPWVAYPGVFAGGGLDAGTALLLAHLPPIAARARVLDFAAGTGVIAAGVLARQPQATIDMIEADAIALEAARENVPLAKPILGTGLPAEPERRYDLILSNPPIHDGIAESRAVLDRLIAGAPACLASGGALVVVVQRRIPVLDALQKAFGTGEIVADDGRFTIAAATTGKRR